MARKRKVAVIDFETDPFLFGRLPRPFAWHFYDGERHVYQWIENAWTNNDSANTLVDFLQSIEEPLLIYAHNGGKFDFMFFVEKLQGAIKIVNGRILKANLGVHELRDSYAILPIPLAAAGDKLSIDYKLMERHCRENHKDEILRYLKQDCVGLYDLVTAFIAEFGDILTVGSAAMRALKQFHDFQNGGESFDKQFRRFYYGGRCQCFETGVIQTRIEGYDLNSSYSHTMRSMRHPVSTEYRITGKPGKNTAFVRWYGENNGAVPIRTKTGLDFTTREAEFFSTIHEFEAGLETGTIKPYKILEAFHFDQMESFDDFIDFYYTSRLKADAAGDIFHKIFYKLILNSAYGKFAQNPDNFEDYQLLPYGDVMSKESGYEIILTHGDYAIWSKPSTQKSYLNVATAASITGGSRATLLRGLSLAKRPLYCDTDSILCEGFGGHVDKKELGAWKLEFTGSSMAIAGKKLYAVMDENDECIKKASKGVMLNPMAIFMIARGDTCETRNDAPSFKLDGNHQFISRRVKSTA